MTSTIEHLELTLMFADIVGYSKLMGQNQALTISLVEDYRNILVKEIENHEGQIIEFIGDGVFARFATPKLGVAAAVAVQKSIFTYNHFREKHLPQLHTRIGLDCGQVAEKDGALFGDHVNITARLEPIAYIDGICLSEAVYEAIKDDNTWPLLFLGVQPLKNIDAKVRVWLLRPAGITLKTRLHYWNKKLNHKLGAYRYPIIGFYLALLILTWYWVPRLLVPGYDANYLEIANFETAMPEGSRWHHLNAGITEAVRAQLADMRDVYVIESGEGIQAPVILEGSVQLLDKSIRVAYRLLRRDGMVQVAGGKLDGTFEEIFILQDRLVAEVARHISDEFNIRYLRPAKRQITDNLTAYDYYLRGLDHLNSPTSHQNSDAAINHFSTALIHDNDFAMAEAGLCQAYWKKYLKSHSSNWIERAEMHCIKALELEPTLPKAIESTGIIYSELGKHDQAIDMLQDILDRDLGNMQAATALADAYNEIGELNKGVEILETALQLQPKNWEGHHMLGFLYLTNGKFKDAVAAYKNALKITPKNTTALNNLGVSYFFIGEFNKAKSAYTKAVDITPNSWGYSNVGLMEYYTGNYSKAKELFQLAIRLSPEDYYYHVNLADTLRYIDGEENSAKQAYLKGVTLLSEIIELTPTDAEANALLANSYYHLNEKSKANAHLIKAVELNPNDPIILAIKARIQSAEGELTGALETLKVLRDLGWSKALIESDPDLRALEEHPEYEQFIKTY